LAKRIATININQVYFFVLKTHSTKVDRMPPSHTNMRDETIQGRKGIKPGKYIICIIAIRAGKDLNELERKC